MVNRELISGEKIPEQCGKCGSQDLFMNWSIIMAPNQKPMYYLNCKSCGDVDHITKEDYQEWLIIQ